MKMHLMIVAVVVVLASLTAHAGPSAPGFDTDKLPAAKAPKACPKAAPVKAPKVETTKPPKVEKKSGTGTPTAEKPKADDPAPVVEPDPVVEPEPAAEPVTDDGKSNNGNGNNTDHDDEDNPGQGGGNHGAEPGTNQDGVDDDEKGKK